MKIALIPRYTTMLHEESLKSFQIEKDVSFLRGALKDRSCENEVIIHLGKT